MVSSSSHADGVLATIVDHVRDRLGERIATVFDSCVRNTLDTTISPMPDGTAFMVTGDIPAMWLRDSTAQLGPYLQLADQIPELADTIVAVLRRQLAYVAIDPYANAFNREPDGAGHSDDVTELSPWVWERKYEVDSLCYPLALAFDLWAATGRTDHLDSQFAAAAYAALTLWRVEQDHDARSPYRFQRLDGPSSDTLVREGLGARTTPVGLTWSGFRPSDDATELGFNIPGNAFAVVVCRAIARIATEVLDDAELAAEATALGPEIDAAIHAHGVVDVEGIGRVLAYEVDGAGGHVLMDDANVPSLLSLPMLGWCDLDDPLYVATRQLLLSERNPYFTRGSHAAGIGSPHTPAGWVWPIALAVQGLTSNDPDERQYLLETLVRTEAGTDLMHESFDPDAPERFTRPWFSWANAMFCELTLDVAGLRRYRRRVDGAVGPS